MKRGSLLWPTMSAAIVALWLVTGCRHTAAISPKGSSSFQILEPTKSRPGTKTGPVTEVPQPRDVVFEAEPIEPLVKPSYPPAARGKQAGPVTLGVRITVDTEGRVSDIGSSLKVFSLPGPFEADFRAAVEAAVKEWRFIPAEIRHLQPARENGKPASYSIVTGTEKTEWRLDVLFTFSPSGEVLLPRPAK
jgi:hypothetical protein